MSISYLVVLRDPSSLSSASMVMACAGHTASHSLHAIPVILKVSVRGLSVMIIVTNVIIIWRTDAFHFSISYSYISLLQWDTSVVRARHGNEETAVLKIYTITIRNIRSIPCKYIRWIKIIII